jgi:hypothetical protein
MSINVIDHGANKHMAAIPSQDRTMVFTHLFATHLLYIVTLWLCRISGLAFYARITKNVARLRTILFISSAVVSLILVAQLLLISVQCIPLEKSWNPMIKGKCLSNVTVILPTVGTSKSTYNCYTLVLQGGFKILILTVCDSHVRLPGVTHSN